MAEEPRKLSWPSIFIPFDRVLAPVDPNDPLFDTNEKLVSRLDARHRFDLAFRRGRAVGTRPKIYLGVTRGSVRRDANGRVASFVDTSGTERSGNPFLPVLLGVGEKRRSPFSGMVAFFLKMHMTIASTGSGLWLCVPENGE